MVTFGGVLSSFSVISTTVISATVPAGWGTLPVQVTAGGRQSPVICGSFLTHGPTLPLHTPEVSSVSPTTGATGSTVTINGAYFRATSTVKFGGIAASGVSLISPGVLHATAPLGAGSVDVTVTTTVGTSPTSSCDLFTIQPIPTIISVTPDQGPVGQSTIIEGRNFLPNASVYFGSTASTGVTVTNTTLLTATAPTGSGTVNVTVRQAGYSSPTTCADNFTYGAAAPTAAPQIEWVTPTANKSFGSDIIAGYNFLPNATVFFGGVPSPQVYYSTSTLLQVEVPLGKGTVPVQVSESSGSSLLTCADRFSIQYPAPLVNFTVKSWTLPLAVAAAPVFVGGSPYSGVNSVGVGIAAGILASNVSDSKIIFYHLNATSATFVPLKIFRFSLFNASSPGNSIGQTSLSVTNGSSGQVAVVSYGQAVFGLFTTFLNGQYVAETLGSSNGGVTWGGPYSTTNVQGSIRDPEVAVSPAGYVYATWRENSGGVWQVDQAVYWPSGVFLSQPTPISGSAGGTILATGPPTLMVDPFGRAVFGWTSAVAYGGGGPTAPAGPLPTGGWSYFRYTGAFISAYSALRTIAGGFNATVPADYERYGGTGLHAFRASINVTLQKLQNDTTNVSRLCLSQQVSFGSLYPSITDLAPGPVALGPPIASCTVTEGLDSSILFDSTGPFSANIYLEVESSNLLEAVGLGSMPIPPWVTGLYSPPPLKGGAFVPGTGQKWQNGQGTAIQVFPVTLNPGSIFLNASGVFWTKYSATNNAYNATTVCGVTSNLDVPSIYSTNLTVKNQAGTTTAVSTFTSLTQLMDIYVTLLKGLRNGTWIEKVTVTYKDTQQSTNYCPGAFGFTNYTRSVTPSTGWPKTFTTTLSGTYTTGLGYFPSNVTLNSTGVNGNPAVMNDNISWQNTIYAVADAWVNQTSSGTHYNVAWTNTTYKIPEYVQGSGLQSVPVGRTYSFTALTQTQAGSANPSWWPTLNSNQVSVAPPIESLKFVCPSFTQLANYPSCDILG
ncbi:MAG: hypothetical protein L3K16_08775 [Thermoplasmata archaeon]|nr:hypothetical protein [Thermoplasmata archaeon]